MTGEIRGRHVLIGFVAAFGTIVAVNVTLATKAVATFPGLETANSYVASQRFEAERGAQTALGWQAEATVEAGLLRLSFRDAAGPVRPVIDRAILGRATHRAEDVEPAFSFDGTGFVAPVDLAPGNWNLRLEARAADGTLFRRRFVLRVPR